MVADKVDEPGALRLRSGVPLGWLVLWWTKPMGCLVVIAKRASNAFSARGDSHHFSAGKRGKVSRDARAVRLV